MKERLLGFFFFATLLAVALSIITDKIHVWLFADSLWYQAHWYIPFVIVPAVCLLVLAWFFGFFRPSGPRWADFTAILGIALLVYCTLGAPYACWHYCF